MIAIYNIALIYNVYFNKIPRSLFIFRFIRLGINRILVSDYKLETLY